MINMTDKIKELIKQMELYAEKQQYEEAHKSLSQIKEELYRTKPIETPDIDVLLSKKEREPITIQQTHNMLIQDYIRLNPEYYPFSRWFSLLQDVNERIKDIKTPLAYTNIQKIRKVVAEEMVCKQMTIPPTYRGKKPNRAFLDETLKVKGGVDICGNEMERRLKSLLWQAVETKDWTKINKAKEDLSKLRGKKYYREYD